MASFILGTAGHIDHGKSSLVKALTGVDPDRLAEEKKRGITIELGFAQLVLPSGIELGIVDVPGHERFIRQMVAGSTGVDIALLVVAADDGVMVQTKEHLGVLSLLGVKRLVVALTKTDVVDNDWIELVEADVRTLLEPTAFQGSPIVRTSVRSGAGLDELVKTLDQVAQLIPSQKVHDEARLPIDRVFSIEGAGTVVTGTLWSGIVRADDTLELLPSKRKVRVRSVQVHGSEVKSARAGQRVAINLANVTKSEVARGMTLASEDSLAPSQLITVWISLLPAAYQAQSLKSGSRVHIHQGTDQAIGQVYLFDSVSLEPGQSGYAQIRLDKPFWTRYGDRCIVRSYSPVTTIGGCEVVQTQLPRLKSLNDSNRRLLDSLRNKEVCKAVNAFVDSSTTPLSSNEVASVLQLVRSEVAACLNGSDFDRIKIGDQTSYISRYALVRFNERLNEQLLRMHDESPQAISFSIASVKHRVASSMIDSTFDALLRAAAQHHDIEIEDGRVRHVRATSSAVLAQQAIADAVIPLLLSGELNPPSVAELSADTGFGEKLIVAALNQPLRDGLFIRLASIYYFTPKALKLAQERVRSALSDGKGATAAELRDALGVSRKYAIPLLEHFDAKGLTRREGDLRFLKE